jgi:hypothetical protein
LSIKTSESTPLVKLSGKKKERKKKEKKQKISGSWTSSNRTEMGCHKIIYFSMAGMCFGLKKVSFSMT